MTLEEFIETIRDGNATALSRLGSSKSLYADTEGEMEAEAVLAAAATAEHHAAEKSKEQVTGFFVGDADPETARLFRGMGEDLDAQLERATDRLAAECGDDEGCWERAEDAATGAIQAAYDEYTERLESMGVNPKPVC